MSKKHKSPEQLSREGQQFNFVNVFQCSRGTRKEGIQKLCALATNDHCTVSIVQDVVLIQERRCHLPDLAHAESCIQCNLQLGVDEPSPAWHNISNVPTSKYGE